MSADDKTVDPNEPPVRPTADAPPNGADPAAQASADGQDTAPTEDSPPEIVLSPEEQRIAELEAVAATAKKGAEDAHARLRAVSKAYTDLQSEMKGFRERQEARAKENSELQAFGLAKAFFDPVMNLKRSLNSAGEGIDEPFMNGLKLVHHQFMEAMNKLGLEEVPGEGAPFDPNLHQALAVTPVADEGQDGKVLAVHAAGYVVKGRVLQAAQVVVGKYQAAETGEA